MKSSSAIFKWPKNLEGTSAPSHAHFLPQVKRTKIFEVAILFSIVKNNNNNVFRDDLPPHSPRGRGLQVTNFDHCLHTVMVIGKCTDVFFGGGVLVWGGWGEGAMWEDLSLEEYVMGEEKINEKGAGFSSIT